MKKGSAKLASIATQERQTIQARRSLELIRLRQSLAEAEEALSAIRKGDVDTVVIRGKKGPQIFTLEGAESGYRVLIESMNEGAVTLTFEGVILYANQCFASMVKSPLEQVLGSSFLDHLNANDRKAFQKSLKGKSNSGSKYQTDLIADDESNISVQISIFKLPKKGLGLATFGVVVSDMTLAHRNEEMLRALTHHVVQAQEAERGRVAYELHDGITQLLCGILFHSQSLMRILPKEDASAMAMAKKLCEVAALTVDEIERIARNLRSGVLEDLGLVAAIQGVGAEFFNRTGVIFNFSSLPLPVRLPLDVELVLYRIFQESLRNVEKHSKARHVRLRLSQQGETIKMVIKDDGIGFKYSQNSADHRGKGGLGLISMRERAIHLGGTLKLISRAYSGTEIEVCIPNPTGKNPV